MKKSRIISAVIAAVMAVSMAVPVGAESIANTAKTELKIGKSYNLSIKDVKTNYDYKVVVPVSGNLTFSYEVYSEYEAFRLFDENGNSVKILKLDPTVGECKDNDGYSLGYSALFGFDVSACNIVWNSVSEKAKGTFTYKIDKGTYYLRAMRGDVGLSDLKLGLSLQNIDGKNVDANGKVISTKTPSAEESTPIFKITLSKGNTIALGTILAPSGKSTSKVTWSSSKTKVATVDTKGKVTAVATGSAYIYAEIGDVTLNLLVKVS
jgi:hypothetical protein